MVVVKSWKLGLLASAMACVFADSGLEIEARRLKGLSRHGDLSVTATATGLNNTDGTPEFIHDAELANAQIIQGKASVSISAAPSITRYVNECDRDRGCTCTSRFVYRTPTQCVRVRLTSQVATNFDPFARATCSRSYDLTPFDCNLCEANRVHTDSLMNPQFGIRSIRDGLSLGNNFNVRQLGFGQSLSHTRDFCIKLEDWSVNDVFAFNLDANCNNRGIHRADNVNTLVFEKCQGNVGINSFEGGWQPFATDATGTIRTAITTSGGTTEQMTQQFTRGWQVQAALPKFMGTTVTGQFSEQMQTTSQDTITTTQGTEQEVTFSTNCQENDRIWLFQVSGRSTFNPIEQFANVPTAFFHCTDPHLDGHQAPRCPPMYCDPTRGTCQCCTSNEWADASVADSDLPPICEGWQA